MWLLLVCLQPDAQNNGMAAHTYTELSGRAVNIYFAHHAEVIMLRAQDGVIFQRLQNLLQMIMAQGYVVGAGDH